MGVLGAIWEGESAIILANSKRIRKSLNRSIDKAHRILATFSTSIIGADKVVLTVGLREIDVLSASLYRTSR